MKIRTGFVTNSSSSSFTLTLKIDRKDAKPLVWKGEGYVEDLGILNACLSPKELAQSPDTAALAEMLKEAVLCDEYDDGNPVQALSDKTKFIKDVKKSSMDDIAKISVRGREDYGGWDHWEQYFEYDCEQKRYTCQFGGVEFVSLDGVSGGSLRVPDAREAEPVEFVIENGVLQYQDRQRQVVVPEGVKKIGKQVFAACMGLERVTVPEGVEEICAEAFAGCRSLERIDLPASVKKISKSAFYDCSGALTIYAPAGSYALSYAKKNGLRFEAV